MQAEISRTNDWQDEVGLVPRYPRLGLENLERLFQGLKEPTISLRNRADKIEIVIGLRSSLTSSQLNSLKRLETHELTISQAFRDVLWGKLEGSRNNTWTVLSRTAIGAYRQAWLHLATVTVLGHPHPETTEDRKKLICNLEKSTRVGDRGRNRVPYAERYRLRKRYNALRKICTEIHGVAEKTVMTASTREAAVPKAVWKAVKPYSDLICGVDSIFNGAAFREMPYKRIPRLDQPKTWKPYQLALALISIETNRQFRTVQRIVAPRP